MMEDKSAEASKAIEDLLEQHHREMARAAAAAMDKHYQETIEICSELLTSGLYEQMAGSRSSVGHVVHKEKSDGSAEPLRNGGKAAWRCLAEARLMMATAMHYTEATYEDIVRVLSFALDAPLDIQKDAYFTLAVVHLSFGHADEGRLSVARCLSLIEDLRASDGDKDGSLKRQEQEAMQLLTALGIDTRCN